MCLLQSHLLLLVLTRALTVLLLLAVVAWQLFSRLSELGWPPEQPPVITTRTSHGVVTDHETARWAPSSTSLWLA